MKLSAKERELFAKIGREGGKAGTGDSKRRVGAANGRYKGKKGKKKK